MLSRVVSSDVCTQCGACCAHYRVSFYWAESEQIPEHMVESITSVYACMKGTNQAQPRCIALQGEIGKQVSCSIYTLRSSACKEVQVADEQCIKARKAYHLIPLVTLEPVEKAAENDDEYTQVG